MGKNKRKNTGLGLAVWILAILIVLIIFLVKQDEIKSNLKKTNFFDKLFGDTPEFISKHKVETEKLPEEDTVITLKPAENKSSKAPEAKTKNEKPAAQKEKEVTDKTKKTVAEEKSDSQKSPEKKTENDKQQKKVENPQKETSVKSPEKTEVASEKKVQPPKNLMKTKICFVHYDSDGLVIRKEVSRSVEKDSPLVGSITSLLNGPDSSEKKLGCMTMIPAGTKLLSATVRNGVAYLNFSDAFEFNTHGVEGYLAQLMQIVYTATEFGTVEKVQFLIEGNVKNYLGSEGVWIGSPLSRISF